jgi:protein-S-isoprenylcysteine O-methyltransferase Ste14
MSIALTRSSFGFRLGSRAARPAIRRNLGELASKIVIVTLFSSMAIRLAQDCAETGHATGLLLLASEALVVALTIVRRTPAAVDRSWRARLVTIFSTFGPPLVKPDSANALAPEAMTLLIAGFGLLIVVGGKISLGRSFGLVPANRGVVSTGVYRFVRHPIYLGYLITHLGFVMANPLDWNWIVLMAADVALMCRAILEERTLAQDPEYAAYMQRVRWRIVPRLF